MNFKRLINLLGIAAVTAAAPQLHAQTSVSEATPPAQAAASSEQNETDEIGQIIVTAQRRSEREADVPMTLAVVSGDDLAGAGVTATTGLYRVTPGIQKPMFGAYVSPSILGVSSNTTAGGLTSNVAFYLDGV